MISASHIKSIIRRLERVDGEAGALESFDLKPIFDQIDSIVAMGPDKRRSIWLTADRGTIEDFCCYDDYIDEESFQSNPDECKRLFSEYYPQKQVWIKLTAFQIPTGERVMYLDGAKIYDATVKTAFVYPGYFDEGELETFIFWLSNTLQISVTNAITGQYEEDMQKRLPYHQRYGVIESKKYWSVFPERWSQFIGDLLEQEKLGFLSDIVEQFDDSAFPIGKRLPSLTARQYYHYVAMLYKTCGYGSDSSELKNADDKQWYYHFADHRDNGFSEIDMDDPKAFEKWVKNKNGDAHNHEIVAGSSRSALKLYTRYSDKGISFELRSNAFGRTIELIKMYNTLRREGVAVYLHHGDLIRSRILQTDLIGIVPSTVWPYRCEQDFPNHRIVDFMHLPEEKSDQLLKYIIWLPEEPVIIRSAGSYNVVDDEFLSC